MSVRIIEVGPRDGLQNEKVPVPTEEKLAFILALANAGLTEIEATSFVSPKWVPQLGDAADLWPLLPPGPRYSALVPNARGLERAIELGVDRIAVFTAASDEFTRRNINMTVAESLGAFGEVICQFRVAQPTGFVRGYVSTAFACPFAGEIDPARTVEVAVALKNLGCDEISIGDTIGVAAPPEVKRLTPMLQSALPNDELVYHFHDTRGTALANVSAALDLGIVAFDSSAGGLGGCPYAPGAGGNLATEDLVYLLERSGVPTGVDLRALAQASLPILARIGRSPAARAQLAVLAGSPQKQ